MTSPSRPWRSYLAEFHAAEPGITERVLSRSLDDDGRTAYEWLLDAVPPDTAEVLDVGCGSGPLGNHVSRAAYLGVDTSTAELRLAARVGRRVASADAARLPLRSGSVDVVVSSMALMLVQPLQSVAHEIARVLRPHGLLCATTPTTGPLTAADRTRWARLLFRLRQSGFTYPNEPDEIVTALAAAGLVVTDDDSRRFAYSVRTRADGELLVRSLYLPRMSSTRQHAAVSLAGEWAPHSRIGLPIRRFVARRKIPWD
jgi:SAM-dependent methyltransferase